MDPAATQYPPNYTFSDTFTKDEDESGFIDLFNMMKEQLDAAGFVVAGPHPEWQDRVHLVLTHQGRKISWLAERVGYNRSQLGKILRKDPHYVAGRLQDVDLLRKISVATGVPLDYFIRG